MPRAYDPKSYFGKKAIREHKKVFRILHDNVDAFTSSDVEPLIPTLIPGTFVNRSGRKDKILWTVFNANDRTVKGKLIEIPVQPATEYTDLWKGAPVTTSIHGSTASLVVEIGPRDVACISEIAER